MKKLIVVVEAHPVIFRGESLGAYFGDDKILIIREDDDHEKLGAFREWDYWYYPKEE